MANLPPHGLEIGVFVVPDATDPATTLGQIEAADQSGLDLVAVQDHPYQRRFFETWTLLAYAAGRTHRVRLLPDVANLPLRPPVVLAKAAASLDVLSAGRVELGLGSGAFWDGISAAGGPRRSPRDAVDAVVEAIGILRDSWDSTASVNRRGHSYDIRGFHPGPAPPHRIGIWLGAYGARMLRVTGQLADGWLPSLTDTYMSPEDALLGQAAVDEAAQLAGRRPEDVIRAVNVMAPETSTARLIEQLVWIVEDLRFEKLLVAVPQQDPIGFVRRLGEEVAPAIRSHFS